MENYSTLSRDRKFRKKSISITVLVILAIALLYGILFSVENFLGGTQPEGVSGSSYASIETGTRAWSDLLIASEYTVTRDRGRVSLPENEVEQPYGIGNKSLNLNRVTNTVVVLDGALPEDEARLVKDFVSAGGRLITDNPYLLTDVLGNRVEVFIDGSTELFASNSNVAGLDGVNKITGSGIGSIEFKRNSDSASLVEFESPTSFDTNSPQTNKPGSSSAIFRLDNGDVIALADSGIVANQNLDLTDNALFSLRISGAVGSNVTFVEGVHGYNDTTGFAGMPLSWRIAIVGLFVAFVIFGTAKGRRFGVGEEPDRNLGPRRIYFAHAIATALKKSKG